MTGSGSRGSTGRQVLVALYAVFAVAAGARSLVQISTRFDEAPLAYSLSLVAAVVYLVATLALRRTTAAGHRVAWAALVFEAVGVVVVGTLSLRAPGPVPRPDGVVALRSGLRVRAAGAAVRRALVAEPPRGPRRRMSSQVMVMPPSTGSVWPVT